LIERNGAAFVLTVRDDDDALQAGARLQLGNGALHRFVQRGLAVASFELDALDEIGLLRRRGTEVGERLRRAPETDHGDVDFRLAGLVRHIVEIALRVRRVEVHRRRKNAVANREHAADHLHRAGGCNQVAHHALD
jgi:hypothetical protein